MIVSTNDVFFELKRQVKQYASIVDQFLMFSGYFKNKNNKWNLSHFKMTILNVAIFGLNLSLATDSVFIDNCCVGHQVPHPTSIKIRIVLLIMRWFSL